MQNNVQCFGVLRDADAARAGKGRPDRHSVGAPAEQRGFLAVRLPLPSVRGQDSLLREGIGGLRGEGTGLYSLLYYRCIWLASERAVYLLRAQFFAQAGFPCPPMRNPSDHFLRCINSDFDKVKATLKGSMKARVSRISPPRSLVFFLAVVAYIHSISFRSCSSKGPTTTTRWRR
jgi:hypothetical protein